MRFTSSPIFPEVIIVEPDAYEDHRSFFLEIYHKNKRALYVPLYSRMDFTF